MVNGHLGVSEPATLANRCIVRVSRQACFCIVGIAHLALAQAPALTPRVPSGREVTQKTPKVLRGMTMEMKR